MTAQRKMRRADTKEVNEVMAMARNDPALMAKINNAIANGLIRITPEGIFVDEAAAGPEPAPIDDSAHGRIAQIAGSPEGRIALERRRTGRSLTPDQAALVREHDALENQLDAQARKERPQAYRVGSDKFGNADRFVAPSTFELAKKPPLEQANAARERMAAIRADRSHPYWNEQDPRHAGAVQEVQALYNGQYYEDGTPVLDDEESKP